MNWTPIDLNNLPQETVLAANFKPMSYGYKEKILGYVDFSKEEDCVVCESENEMLLNVTHYIKINDYDL
jgi:hypothetical protein